MNFSELSELFVDVGQMLASYVTSPEKRLCFGYLLTSAFLAFWVFVRSRRGGAFLAYLFDRKVWLGPSARLDYKLITFNAVFKILLLGQFLVYGLHIAFEVDELVKRSFGAPQVNWSATETIVLYTFAITFLGDLSVYVVHRLMHRVPLLWRFHRVHHSATTLTPFTQLRIHPVELVINNARSIVVFGVLTGVFGSLTTHEISKWTFVGVNVFAFAFFSMGANLRHSHVRLRYWHAIEHVFMSPYQHQIHHSTRQAHHDRNYGSKLALWDWVFGTLVPSKGIESVRFGLGDEAETQGLFSSLVRPFTRKEPPEYASRR